MPDQVSRRLDPRLRMIRNGGAEVNSVRSDISTTVVSTSDIAGGVKPEEMPSLVQAQESAQSLDATPLVLDTGPLSKRPKLNDVEAQRRLRQCVPRGSAR